MNVICDMAEFFTSFRNSVQAELKEIINNSPASFHNILQYHMGWCDKNGYPYQGKLGKFIRSTLCLLSCEAVGGNIEQILPAAATLEFIHNSSLIHDDIQDGSYERHGRPTVWKLWGQSQAINTGDVMFALACLALVKLKKNGVNDEAVVHSFGLLGGTYQDLCDGQYLDIEYENRLSITVEDYLNMIRKKTAALIAASTSLGAYLGKGGEVVSYLYHFGEALGITYQIRDDILGIWGTKESMGKSVEGDIQQRKKTLPVIYALNTSGSKDKAELERLYSQGDIQGENISTVVRVLVQSGAKDYSQNLAEQYYHRALEQLEASGVEKHRQAPLKEMARFLLERDY